MKKIVYTILSLSPALTLAAEGTFNTSYFTTILAAIKGWVKDLIPIAFGVAIIYFFWGIAKYIKSAGDPKAAEAGRSAIIWGLIAIAVMASVWGIVAFLGGIFGVNTSGGGTIQPPTINGLG